MGEINMYKLFLDDYRIPLDCVSYMHSRIGKENPIYLEDWITVKDYREFIWIVETNGVPEIVSFDHDLADEHYSQEYNDMPEMYDTCQEKTGADCALWLKEYCLSKNIPFPKYFIHSMNPVGCDRIKNIIE